MYVSVNGISNILQKPPFAPDFPPQPPSRYGNEAKVGG